MARPRTPSRGRNSRKKRKSGKSSNPRKSTRRAIASATLAAILSGSLSSGILASTAYAFGRRKRPVSETTRKINKMKVGHELELVKSGMQNNKKMRNDLEALKSQCEEDLKSLKDESQNLKKEIKSRGHKIGSFHQQWKNLKREKQKKEQNLQSQMEELKATVEDQKAQLKDIDVLQAKLTAEHEQLVAVKAQLETQVKKTDELKGEKERFEQDFIRLHKGLEELRQTEKELRANLSNLPPGDDNHTSLVAGVKMNVAEQNLARGRVLKEMQKMKSVHGQINVNESNQRKVVKNAGKLLEKKTKNERLQEILTILKEIENKNYDQNNVDTKIMFMGFREEVNNMNLKNDHKNEVLRKIEEIGGTIAMQQTTQ